MLLSGCFSLHVVKCVKSVLCAGKKQQHNLQVLLLCSGNVQFCGFLCYASKKLESEFMLFTCGTDLKGAWRAHGDSRREKLHSAIVIQS